MDRKSIIVIVICFVLLVSWSYITNLIFPPKKVPLSTNAVASTVISASNGVESVKATTNQAIPTISQSTRPALPAPTWTKPSAPEKTLTVENAQARYIFSSYGGGLKKIELKGYPEFTGCTAQQRGLSNRLATLNGRALVPAMTLFGGAAMNDAQPFALARTANGVEATQTLTNGLRIVKDFVLGTNHLIHTTIRVENRGKAAVDLPQQELVVGTAGPINLHEGENYLGVQWYNGEHAQFIGESWFANHAMGCGCLPGHPRTVYLSPAGSNVVWVALHSQFFTMIAAPATNVTGFVARHIDLLPPTPEELADAPKAPKTLTGYQAALLYPAKVLPAGGAETIRVALYAGPKEYHTLARLPKSQDLAMNFTSFFGWFAKALLLSMNFLHSLGVPYGLSIILITVIIRVTFWPLTQAGTRSMKRMQQLQPQMKALQAKYKDDPKKMNAKLMEFMKENKVSPLGGCWPMLLQIPVLFGFYEMLRSAVELRGASFLWACDLSQPDTIFTISGLGWIPILGIPNAGLPINPLPLIMGATQFWQARLTPPSPGVDPVQQKMMQYLPLIFILMLYNFSSGLALYWTVNNLLSILQMKLTKTTPIKTPPAAAPVKSAPRGRK